MTEDVRVGDRVTVSGVVRHRGYMGTDVALDGAPGTIYTFKRDVISQATITRALPTDPDVFLVRRKLAEGCRRAPYTSNFYRSGENDDDWVFQSALAVAKEIRKEYEK